MGERTSYTPGTFSWADLTTTDLQAAKDFYGGLFGWKANDMPVGEGVVYSMQEIDGKPVAAISPQPQAQADAGVPPMWNSYVTVESADAAAAKAAELGASVHAPPFDVMDAGRMAVIQDPQGAFVMVWEPKRHPGAALVNGHGTLSWDELSTPDMAGASAFYSGLFGWELTPMEGMPMEYSIINNAGRSNGGIHPTMPPGSPPHWLVYFGSDDIDASVAKATELGGTSLAGVMDIGVGKIAPIQDPQGAVFALYSGEFQD
jgi:predicted enzyme related to lactoylglutathione lyase